jgi:hypothetical protein
MVRYFIKFLKLPVFPRYFLSSRLPPSNNQDLIAIPWAGAGKIFHGVFLHSLMIARMCISLLHVRSTSSLLHVCRNKH